MLHAELPSRGQMEMEERPRYHLPREHPVMRFHDDERKTVQRAGITLEE